MFFYRFRFRFQVLKINSFRFCFRFQVVQHVNFAPFSIGKRRCLGENLAKAEYAVFAISLLRNFTFKMGDPSNPPALQGFGLVYSPLPFEMLIERRAHVAG